MRLEQGGFRKRRCQHAALHRLQPPALLQGHELLAPDACAPAAKRTRPTMSESMITPVFYLDMTQSRRLT